MLSLCRSGSDWAAIRQERAGRTRRNLDHPVLLLRVRRDCGSGRWVKPAFSSDGSRGADASAGLRPTQAGAHSWQGPCVQAARFGRRTRTVAEPRDELTSARNVVCGSPKSGPPQFRRPEALSRITRRGFGVSRGAFLLGSYTLRVSPVPFRDHPGTESAVVGRARTWSVRRSLLRARIAPRTSKKRHRPAPSITWPVGLIPLPSRRFEGPCAAGSVRVASFPSRSTRLWPAMAPEQGGRAVVQRRKRRLLPLAHRRSQISRQPLRRAPTPGRPSACSSSERTKVAQTLLPRPLTWYGRPDATMRTLPHRQPPVKRSGPSTLIPLCDGSGAPARRT